MKDEDKCLLQNYIDGCKHKRLTATSWICKLCGELAFKPDNLRTFNTWQDLGDLKKKVAENGEWKRFLVFAFESDLEAEGISIEDLSELAMDDGEKFYDSDFLDWLLNPARFCQLVADWRKENP